MKRFLMISAIALGVAAPGLPALAQQAPITAPNPSTPPPQDPATTPRASGNNAAVSSTGTSPSAASPTVNSATSPNKATEGGKRSQKPREKGSPPAPTADAPSGPKGDSPEPARKP